MAGSVIEIQKVTVSSAVSGVTLTGIDTTYDVYKLVINNLTPSTINADVYLQVTEGGSVSTDSDYDYAAKLFRTDTTFGNLTNRNSAYWPLSGSLNNTVGKGFQNITYIFNAYDSSQYTMVTIDSNYLAEDGSTLLGYVGGGTYTQNTSVNGVHIKCEAPTSNIASGTFTLYGLKK